MRRGTMMAPAALAVPAVAAAGCGDDGGEEVNVVLPEFIVEPDDPSVDAGEVVSHFAEGMYATFTVV